MFDNLTIGPGVVINAGITISSKTANPLTLTRAELTSADGGLTDNGFSGDEIKQNFNALKTRYGL